MNFTILLPIFRGIFSAMMVTSDKYLLSVRKLDSCFVAYMTKFVSVVLLLMPLYFLDQFQHLENLKFWTYTLANVIGNICITLLGYYTLRKFDASYVVIIKSTQPFIFGIIAFIILGEVISNLAILGIFFVMVGAILLEKSRLNKQDKFNIISLAWPLVLTHMIISGIITNFSKMAVLEADALIYLWLRCLIMTIIFYIAYQYKFKKMTKVQQDIEKVEPKYALLAAFSGLLLLLTTICEMYALKYLPIAKVEALARVDLIVLLILEYFFITKVLNIKRIMAAGLVLVGVVLLILN